MKKAKHLCMTSFILLTLSAMSILFIPLGLAHRPEITLKIIGVLFWGLLAAGILCMFPAGRMLRKKQERGAPGILRFFSSKPALITDILMLVLLAAMIPLLFTHLRYTYGWYIYTACTFLSVYMHAMLNGRVYIALFHPETIRRKRK